MAILTDRDLLDILCDLNFRMTHYGGKTECNLLERYHYFITHAEKKKYCNYALKYRDMFLTHDYEEIRKLVLEAAAMLASIEPGTAPPILSPPYEDED
jgi:hypothetical protein